MPYDRGMGRSKHAWKRIALRTAIALTGALALLLSMAVAGSMIPANGRWTPPRQGVAIYVYSNGVHTGLVLPAANDIHDWRTRMRAADLPDPRRAGPWLLFGWGQRDFYLNTPRWSDLDPLLVVRAMIGSDRTLMHVDHLQRLWRGPDLRRVMLTPGQYRALADAIDRDFAPGAPIPGYGADDVFYPGRGRYDAVVTCNEWTGAKLRGVGVKVGFWTPAAWSVMRWFGNAPAGEQRDS